MHLTYEIKGNVAQRIIDGVKTICDFSYKNGGTMTDFLRHIPVGNRNRWTAYPKVIFRRNFVALDRHYDQIGLEIIRDNNPQDISGYILDVTATGGTHYRIIIGMLGVPDRIIDLHAESDNIPSDLLLADLCILFIELVAVETVRQ